MLLVQLFDSAVFVSRVWKNVGMTMTCKEIDVM